MAKKKRKKLDSAGPIGNRESAAESRETGAEGEDDLVGLRSDRFSQVAVGGTDWTVETLVGQLRKGALALNPEFQRRDAWTDLRRSRFIESCFLGLPIPQLVLAEDKKTKGSFIVIDGKQRLLSLAQFAGLPNVTNLGTLRLEDLTVRKDLNGKSLADIEQSMALRNDLNGYLNHTIRTVVVKNWPDEEFLWLVFLRLNTNSVALAPQELRQALHPGPFVQYANDYSSTSDGLRFVLGLRRPDFRMRDVELFIRFIGFQMFLSKYSGNMKQFLDGICQVLNQEWKACEADVVFRARVMEEAIHTTRTIFGDDGAFRIWRGDKYEKRSNRAVFDVMTYYFASTTVRKRAQSRYKKVAGAFQSLCERSEPFMRSLEVTTKSIEATRTRLQLWGSSLRKAIDMPELDLARLGDDRAAE